MGRQIVRGLIAAAILLAVAAGALFGSRWWFDRPVNPLTADGASELAVMDFAQPVALDPPARGWRHRTFLTRPAMTISQTEKDGRQALKCETEGSGSIFGRFTDIDLTAYPGLAWSWLVEKPVDSPLDERTVEGDDHPAVSICSSKPEMGRTIRSRSSGPTSSSTPATTNISARFRIMWRTAGTRMSAAGSRSGSTF